jgi:Sec-independent protein translocase protein TatA
MPSGALSPVHILIVLTVALIVLGPEELPKVARRGAKVLRELRALRARLDEEIHDLLEEEPEPHSTSVEDEEPGSDSGT